jgi:hypothetical protein
MPELWAPPTSFAGKVRNSDNTGLQDATPGQQAAMTAIAGYAASKQWTTAPSSDPNTPSAQCPNATDAIRGTYCNTTGQVIQTLKDNVSGLTYADLNTTSFTSADFDVAHTTYVNELGDVANLRAGINAYQQIYTNDATTSNFSASQIGQDIQDQLDKVTQLNTTQTSTTDPLDVLSFGADLLEHVPEVGDAFSYVSTAMEFAKLLNSDDSDQPVPSLPHQVELSAANAGATIGSSYLKSSSELSRNGDYMVEDPQKLLTGAYDMSKGDLALTTDRTAALEKTAAAGMREYLWGAILGTSFANWTGDPALGPFPVCGLSDRAEDPSYYPGYNMGDSGTWMWRLPATTGSTIQRWWIMENQTSQPDSYIYGHSNVGLPKAMSDQLFGAFDPTKDASDDTQNVGAVAPYFQLKYLPFMPLKSYPKGALGKGCYAVQ